MSLGANPPFPRSVVRVPGRLAGVFRPSMTFLTLRLNIVSRTVGPPPTARITTDRSGKRCPTHPTKATLLLHPLLGTERLATNIRVLSPGRPPTSVAELLNLLIIPIYLTRLSDP